MLELASSSQRSLRKPGDLCVEWMFHAGGSKGDGEDAEFQATLCTHWTLTYNIEFPLQNAFCTAVGSEEKKFCPKQAHAKKRRPSSQRSPRTARVRSPISRCMLTRCS